MPDPLDFRLIHYEAGAAALAAANEGISLRVGPNPTPERIAKFEAELDLQVRYRTAEVRRMREELPEQGRQYLIRRHADRYAPFSLREGSDPVYEVEPVVDAAEYVAFAHRLGVSERSIRQYLPDNSSPENGSSEIRPGALTEVLTSLRDRIEGDGAAARLARQELEILSQIAIISPSAGFALAVRRSRTTRPENLARHPTVFHRPEVLRALYEVIPEAKLTLQTTFDGLPEVL